MKNLKDRALTELDELRKTRFKMKDKFEEDLEKTFWDTYCIQTWRRCVEELGVLNKFSLQLAFTKSKSSKTR